MPKMYIVAGCNGAGKTTASYTLLPDMLECSQFVNSDEFAKSISPFNPSEAAIRASRYMLMKVKYVMERGEDFGIETTLATRTLLKMTRDAQSRGYSVTVLYFWLDSPGRAIERVKARVATGGHNIPDDTVIRRYHSGLRYFFYEYMNTCDRWLLVDNSTPPFRLVAEGTREGEINLRDPDTFLRIKAIADQAQREYQEGGGRSDE